MSGKQDNLVVQCAMRHIAEIFVPLVACDSPRLQGVRVRIHEADVRTIVAALLEYDSAHLIEQLGAIAQAPDRGARLTQHAVRTRQTLGPHRVLAFPPFGLALLCLDCHEFPFEITRSLARDCSPQVSYARTKPRIFECGLTKAMCLRVRAGHSLTSFDGRPALSQLEP